MEKPSVGIIGAGPLGIELACSLKRAQIPYVHFDKGQAAQMIYNFPPNTPFFSSSERISISGIPIQTTDQQKCKREEYLAYIRSVIMQFKLKINTYEEVVQIENIQSEGFRLFTQSAKGQQSYQVRYLVLATGGTSYPKSLGIPGEMLSHVSTRMVDPHHYFNKQVVIVGGRNSAAENAIRLFNAGAKVSIVYRKKALNENDEIKYWLIHELMNRISSSEITFYPSSILTAIKPDRVVIQNDQGEITEQQVDFVIKAIGFEADMRLFKQIGVNLGPERSSVMHDESMQTNVPDLYVLGTVIAGTQDRYRIFIENSHIHIEKIMKSLSEKLGIKADVPKSIYVPKANLEE